VLLPAPLKRRTVFSAIASLCGLSLLLLQLTAYPFMQQPEEKVDAGMRAIGKAMLSAEAGGYALPFELVSILLLAAMIGCIVIALKPNPNAS
jgi:NADH-quinone oxidoreductase subunit J